MVYNFNESSVRSINHLLQKSEAFQSVHHVTLGITGKNLTLEEVYTAWFSNINPEALDSVYASLKIMEQGERDENTYIWNHPLLGPRYVRCGGVGKPVEGGMVYRGYHYDVDDDVRKRKKKDQELAEQLEIIQALSMSFRNVFTANLQDGRAKVLRLAEDYQVKAVREVSKDFFPFDELIRRWTKENVCPEDRDQIAQIMNMENLRRVFAKQNQLVGTYRSMEGDKLHNYQYDFRRVGDTDTIVAGFRIIDAIVKEQETRLKKENMQRLVPPCLLFILLLKISTSGAHLLSLINDVLDMSRIESGSVKLEEDNRQKAFACGMNEHIIKPIAIETIARVLDEIFQEKGKGHITVD